MKDEIKNLRGELRVLWIIVILIVVLLAVSSCTTPAIVTQQKALCTYSDSRVARFEYRRTEHLNEAVTIYEAEPRNYKVGQTYVIKIKGIICI